MKNTITLSGRLPLFEGKYTPANGDKKSRMNWSMNVQLNTKNDNGYYDEALIDFTAWGYYADQLQQISSLPKDDAKRKEFSNISVTGRLIVGYKDKEGNIVQRASIEMSEFEFNRRLVNNNEDAFGPKSGANSGANAGATRPGGVPTGAGRPGGAPTGASRPGGIPGGVPGARPAMPGMNGPRF